MIHVWHDRWNNFGLDVRLTNNCWHECQMNLCWHALDLGFMNVSNVSFDYCKFSVGFNNSCISGDHRIPLRTNGHCPRTVSTALQIDHLSSTPDGVMELLHVGCFGFAAGLAAEMVTGFCNGMIYENDWRHTGYFVKRLCQGNYMMGEVVQIHK